MIIAHSNRSCRLIVWALNNACHSSIVNRATPRERSQRVPIQRISCSVCPVQFDLSFSLKTLTDKGNRLHLLNNISWQEKPVEDLLLHRNTAVCWRVVTGCTDVCCVAGCVGQVLSTRRITSTDRMLVACILIKLNLSLYRLVVASSWASPSTWKSARMETRWDSKFHFNRADTKSSVMQENKPNSETCCTIVTMVGLEQPQTSGCQSNRDPVEILTHCLSPPPVFRSRTNLFLASTWWSPSAWSSWCSAFWAAVEPSKRTAACCWWWESSRHSSRYYTEYFWLES